MKYVMMRVRTPGMNRDFPIIFPNDLSHIDVAKAVRAGCPELKTAKAISAGEIASMSLGVECHGKSMTLGGLKSREKLDDHMIMMRDYNAGIDGT